MSLEYAVMHWLAWEKRCHAVLFERSPRDLGASRPDVLGITKSRYLMEVEIKRTVADFKANARKRHVHNRPYFLKIWPKQFWFCVPDTIADAVLPMVPDWSGLLKLRDGAIICCVKQSPSNPESKRLSIRECVRLCHLLSNQLVAGIGAQWKAPHEDWYQFESGFYGTEYQI